MKILSDRKILLISPEAWGTNFVSKHHYAIALAERDNLVFFLNPPTKTCMVSSTIHKNIYQVDYKPFVSGLRYMPICVQRWLISKKYQSLERLVGYNFDIIWSFDNSVFYDFSALPKRLLKISHIMDFNQNFQVATAAQTADICLGVTDIIQRRLYQYNKNSFKIQHGYTPQSSAAHKLPNLKESIKAMYVGNLSIPFIDWKAIRSVVESNTAVAFIFIGPDGDSNLGKKTYYCTDKEAVKAMPNAYFIGAISYDKIPNTLQQADILLLAYQKEQHVQAANPHKLLEYLGSGKVTVATYTDEYRDKKMLLAMCEKDTNYSSLFTNVVGKLDEYNASNKLEERKNFAMANTYEKQIRRIEKIIKKVNYKILRCE